MTGEFWFVDRSVPWPQGPHSAGFQGRAGKIGARFPSCFLRPLRNEKRCRRRFSILGSYVAPHLKKVGWVSHKPREPNPFLRGASLEALGCTCKWKADRREGVHGYNRKEGRTWSGNLTAMSEGRNGAVMPDGAFLWAVGGYRCKMPLPFVTLQVPIRDDRKFSEKHGFSRLTRWEDQAYPFLEAAEKPQALNLPGYRFHQLKGEYRGFYSVTVTGNN